MGKQAAFALLGAGLFVLGLCLGRLSENPTPAPTPTEATAHRAQASQDDLAWLHEELQSQREGLERLSTQLAENEREIAHFSLYVQNLVAGDSSAVVPARAAQDSAPEPPAPLRSAPAAPPAANLDALRKGALKEEIVALLGPPEHADELQLAYFSQGAAVNLDADGRLESVTLLGGASALPFGQYDANGNMRAPAGQWMQGNPGWRLHGVRMGMSLADVTRVLGRDCSMEFDPFEESVQALHYARLDLVVFFSRSGTVNRLRLAGGPPVVDANGVAH